MLQRLEEPRVVNKRSWIFNQDHLQCVPVLLMIVLLVQTVTISPYWFLRISMLLLCLAMAALPNLLTSWKMWYFMAVVQGATLFMHWESADNHRYLFAYGCLALASAYSLPIHQQKRALAFSAKLLIGLCMAFAIYWKVSTHSYMDGSFFHYSLLTDDRFEHVTCALGSISSQLLGDNRELEQLLMYGHLRGIEISSISLSDTSQIGVLSQFLTWWTILIEGALAIVFLLPNCRMLSVARNCLLLLFAGSTYAVANVIGFGWVLMVLGLAQCSDDEKGFQFSYILAFLLIQAYAIPYPEILKTLANIGA